MRFCPLYSAHHRQLLPWCCNEDRGEFSLEACENPWPCKHSLRESVFLWSAHQQLESEELNYRCRAACEGQPLTFHPGLFLSRAQSGSQAEPRSTRYPLLPSAGRSTEDFYTSRQ